MGWCQSDRSWQFRDRSASLRLTRDWSDNTRAQVKVTADNLNQLVGALSRRAMGINKNY